MTSDDFGEFCDECLGVGAIVALIVLCLGTFISAGFFDTGRDALIYGRDFFRALEGKPIDNKDISHDAEILKKIFQGSSKGGQEEGGNVLASLGEFKTRSIFGASFLMTASEILRGKKSNVSETISIPSWLVFWQVYTLSAIFLFSLSFTVSFVVYCLMCGESLLDWHWRRFSSWACYLIMFPTLIPFLLVEIGILKPIKKFQEAVEQKRAAVAEREAEEAARRAEEYAQRREQEEYERLARLDIIRSHERNADPPVLPPEEDDIDFEELMRQVAACAEAPSVRDLDGEGDLDGIDFAELLDNEPDDELEDMLVEKPPEPKPLSQLEMRRLAARKCIQEALERFEETKKEWRDYFLRKAGERERYLERDVATSKGELARLGEELSHTHIIHAHRENLLREWKKTVSGVKENKGKEYLREIELLMKLKHVKAIEIRDTVLLVYTDTLFVQYDKKIYELGIFELRIGLFLPHVVGVYNLASTHPQGKDYPYGSEGRFCFGDLTDTISTALQKGEFAAAVEYMIQSISHINPGEGRKIEGWKEVTP